MTAQSSRASATPPTTTPPDDFEETEEAQSSETTEKSNAPEDMPGGQWIWRPAHVTAGPATVRIELAVCIRLDGLEGDGRSA